MRIVQITDTHLYADATATLKGFDTRASLDAVVAAIAADPIPPGHLILTGDLSQDEHPGSYRALGLALRPLACAAHALPGNHDDPVAMAEGFADLDSPMPIHMPGHLWVGNWLLVLLDSRVPGCIGGALGDTERARLAVLLAAHEDAPTLVFLHHPPVAMGSTWMDAIGLDDRVELMDIVHRHHAVRGVVWGHVHQEMDRMVKGVRLLSTPSTCIQFTPGTDTYALDSLGPGYRWFDLDANGTFDTGVVRMAVADFRASAH